MSDKYGYIGIETLLNYCQNSKDHSITPNDFMRMNRVKLEELEQDEIPKCNSCLDWNPDLKYCMHLAKFMDSEDYCSEHRKEGN